LKKIEAEQMGAHNTLPSQERQKLYLS
jgi:hypothetical protein